jgi:hypothetical protein
MLLKLLFYFWALKWAYARTLPKWRVHKTEMEIMYKQQLKR